MAAKRIGQPVDQRHCAGRRPGDPQQRQKENRWLHGVSIGLRVCKAPRMRVVFRKSSLGAERYATAALIVIGLGQAESKLMQL
jgi:hypothetical protein